MKKLEELGISPAPWMVLTVNGSLHSVEASPCFIGDLMHIATVCNMRKARPSDARLIAAAPKLYEALREAVKSYCEGCNDFVNEDQRCDPCECPARKWRAVLAEAAGDGGEA